MIKNYRIVENPLLAAFRYNDGFTGKGWPG
jgi:hypothetical protein